MTLILPKFRPDNPSEIARVRKYLLLLSASADPLGVKSCAYRTPCLSISLRVSWEGCQTGELVRLLKC